MLGTQPYTPGAPYQAGPATPFASVPQLPTTPFGPPQLPSQQLPSTPFNTSMQYPAQPYPQQPRVDLAPQQRATHGYDMGRQAAREALIRKLVWFIVLIVAGVGGIILATQL
jgi:hypothetical protein